MSALPTMQTETNALAANVYANAVEADADAAASLASKLASANSEAAAAAAANLAATNAGASIWVSGTTYALGDVRWSPASRYTYRRIVGGSGTTDPSADAANWALAGSYAPQMIISTTTANSMVANQHLVLTSAALSTATLPAAPTAGDLEWVTVGNGRYDNVIARNGQSIMGLAEDMTINSADATVALRFINTTLGWRLV